MISINSGNTSLTLSGNGFVPGTVALWNGSPGATTIAVHGMKANLGDS